MICHVEVVVLPLRICRIMFFGRWRLRHFQACGRLDLVKGVVFGRLLKPAACGRSVADVVTSLYIMVHHGTERPLEKDAQMVMMMTLHDRFRQAFKASKPLFGQPALYGLAIRQGTIAL